MKDVLDLLRNIGVDDSKIPCCPPQMVSSHRILFDAKDSWHDPSYLNRSSCQGFSIYNVGHKDFKAERIIKMSDATSSDHEE